MVKFTVQAISFLNYPFCISTFDGKYLSYQNIKKESVYIMCLIHYGSSSYLKNLTRGFPSKAMDMALYLFSTIINKAHRLYLYIPSILEAHF